MTMTAAAEIASSASRRRAGRPRMTQGASEPPNDLEETLLLLDIPSASTRGAPP